MKNNFMQKDFEKTKFTLGAFGVIFDDEGRVLLCHRTDHDLWNLPGGTVEPGETPADTVIREVKEETGFEVEIVKLIGVYSKEKKNDLVFSFACKIISGERTLNFEADKIEYFAVSDLPVNLPPNHLDRINDARLGLSETIFKIQKGKSSLELLKELKLNGNISAPPMAIGGKGGFVPS